VRTLAHVPLTPGFADAHVDPVEIAKLPMVARHALRTRRISPLGR